MFFLFVENCSDAYNETILSNESEHALLYLKKKFKSWEDCEIFISEWAKEQGFQVIKDCVTHDCLPSNIHLFS